MICQAHWDRLRDKIEERGLIHLVAANGQVALEQVLDQLEPPEGRDSLTPANYDPLMSAYWTIGTNAARMIASAGGNPLYLMGGGPEDKVDGSYGPAGLGRTWPRCGICYLGLVHELTCREEDCMLPRHDPYAWMLDRAAAEAQERAVNLGLVNV